MSAPKIGVVWAIVRGKPVRKFLMPRTRHHIYYEIEPETGDIYIHAIWGAPKDGDARVRAEPFDAIEIELGNLWAR